MLMFLQFNPRVRGTLVINPTFIGYLPCAKYRAECQRFKTGRGRQNSSPSDHSKTEVAGQRDGQVLEELGQLWVGTGPASLPVSRLSQCVRRERAFQTEGAFSAAAERREIAWRVQ